MKSVRVLVLVLLALGLLLIGCSKQEAPPPSPSPSPTATPPPQVTGNKHCQDQSGTCQITSDDIYAEAHPQGGGDHHDCSPWDDSTAIHITKGNAGNGKFKKIHVIAGANHKQFTISVEPCTGSTGTLFPNAKNSNNNDWNSGDPDTTLANDSHFHLVMMENTKKGMKKSDPHIVLNP